MGRRTIFLAVALALTLGSIAAFLGNGLRYGVDFTGGIVLEVQTEGPANLDQLRGELNALGLGDVTLQGFGAADVVLINVPRQEGEEEAQQEAIQLVQATIGERAKEYRRVEAVGPKVGDELRTGAIIA